MELNEAIKVIKETTLMVDGKDLQSQNPKEREQTLALFCVVDAIKDGRLIPTEK